MYKFIFWNRQVETFWLDFASREAAIAHAIKTYPGKSLSIVEQDPQIPSLETNICNLNASWQ